MKKLAIVLSCLLCAGSNILAQNFNPYEQDPYRNLGAPLPEFRVVDKEGKSHTPAEFKKDGTLFLFLFNPGCEHCILTANRIRENEADFAGSNVYFVAASDMLPYFDSFYSKTQAALFKNTQVGVDSSDMVRKIYKYVTLPQINIYDKKDHKLIKVFAGETPVDSLRAYIGK